RRRTPRARSWRPCGRRSRGRRPRRRARTGHPARRGRRRSRRSSSWAPLTYAPVMDGSVWVILPTYDEAENLEAVVGGIRASLPEACILVVDDNSPDGTGRLAEELGLDVLHRPGKAGLGSAYMAGFAYALDRGAGFVVEMDADLSHDPADLPRLLEPALDGADLVLGSRYVTGGGIENW